MTAASRKALRDAWRERTRSIFVIFAIAAGVAAVLTLLGSAAILTRELNRGYLAANPPSAILHTESIDAGMLKIARSDPEVATADARGEVLGRIKTGPAQWRNLLLTVIANYHDIRLNRFVPEQGAWPPARGEMLIERDALHVAPVKLGDPVTLRAGEGPAVTLRVTGRVHDVTLAQARMENSVYGYITIDTLPEIGQKAVLNRLLIEVAHHKYNEEHIRQVAAGLKQRLERQGYRVDRITFPTPGKHPHADLMQALLLAISSFGFFLLALSGVLVLNFTSALMARQIRLVGVMKALGGTGRQIARIYLLQWLMLGVVATAIAVPAGIWGSHILCQYMAMFLNFDITSFFIPVWVFLVAAGAGMALPLVSCAVPVWRTVAIPVRRALASVGTSQENFGVGAVERVLTQIGGPARPVLLAVRNSFRRRVRLALTCLSLTCAGMFFMTALNLRTSMVKTFDRLFAAARYDVTLYLEQKYPVDQINAAMRGVPGVLGSENWVLADGATPRKNSVQPSPSASGKSAGKPASAELQSDDDRNTFTVIAMPPESKLFSPVMAKGRRLEPGDTNSVVLNPTMAARNPQMRVGDQVRLRIGALDQNWRVVGICREPMLPPPIVYVPISAVNAGDSGVANLVQIKLKDPRGASLESARAGIDLQLDHAGIRVSGASSKAEFRAAVDAHVLMIYVFQLLAACIVGAVGGLGLLTTMGINVLERRREIGVLRAIGATPAMISAIVIGEALTVASMAWCAAVVLAYPLTKAVGGLLGQLLHGGFDVGVAAVGIEGCLAGLAILAGLASAWAARSAVRVSVRDALAYE